MIETEWVGRRISVRRAVGRGDDGRILFGDVVGELTSLTGGVAVLAGREGPVEVPVELVAAARLVEPSAAQVLALEAVMAKGWRAAETEQLDGWLLRANEGFTQRANSVLPLGQLARPSAEAVSTVADWYAARGLAARFQVPTEARRLLDAHLQENGWVPTADTHVLVTGMERLRDASSVPVTFSPTASPEWVVLARGDQAPAAAVALLERHDCVIFASIEQAGRVVAVGRGTVDEGWLGIFSLSVEPEFRRLGLGSALLLALADWGVANGASRAYLQVESENTAAIELYRKLGFWRHHDYRYRIAPTTPPPPHPIFD